jgi:hypothetical protein
VLGVLKRSYVTYLLVSCIEEWICVWDTPPVVTLKCCNKDCNLYMSKYGTWRYGTFLEIKVCTFHNFFHLYSWMRFLFAFTGTKNCWTCFMKKQDIISWKAGIHVKYPIISCWEAFRLVLNWVHTIPRFTLYSILGMFCYNYLVYLRAYKYTTVFILILNLNLK